MDYITKKLKSFDMFGHKFTFYFNGSQDAHTTLAGGIVSTLIYIVMIW